MMTEATVNESSYEGEGSKYCDGVVAAIGSGGVAGRQRSDGWKSGSAVCSRGWQGWI